MAKSTYQTWIHEDDSCSLQTLAEIERQKGFGNLDGTHLLYSINADTPEEAMAIHHLRMGWEPYVPMGAAVPCPKQCGQLYYPEGSGVCPECGAIG